MKSFSLRSASFFFSPDTLRREQRFLFLFWAVSNHASPLKCIGYNEDRELEQKKKKLLFRSRISRGRELSYWVYVLYCILASSRFRSIAGTVVVFVGKFSGKQ